MAFFEISSGDFVTDLCYALRFIQVPIAWSSMNDGDAYILDVGGVLFVWCGKHSSRTERIKVCVFELFFIVVDK